MSSWTDYLLNHAYQNVWCTPGQDRQYILTPARLTPLSGVKSTVGVVWSKYALPTADWYHVFQIGGISPETLGMVERREAWVPVGVHCEATALLIDLYVGNGLMIPRHQAYFLYTRSGALVIAVKHTPQIAHLGREALYIRWRSNAYFERLEGRTAQDGIEAKGMLLATSKDLVSFQKLWRDAQARKGTSYAFKNGRRVRDLNPTTMAVGDHVEFVRDSSILEVVRWNVDDLLSFESSLDKKAKLLLPRPGLGTRIDYEDDVDIFLLYFTQAQVYTGLYYHKNAQDALRMVTHRDYSLVLPYLQAYLPILGTDVKLTNLTVEAFIRESGYDRQLVNEQQRIKELFKLPEAKRLQAMVGTNATVEVWQAPNLEASVYNQIMRAADGSITKDMVETAYGYNAISRLIGDTPQIRKTTDAWMELPRGLWERATVYEYDVNGRLLGWHLHDGGPWYAVSNQAKCYYIEAIIGFGGPRLSTEYGKAKSTLVDGVDYRYYVCTLWNGKPLGDWKDVTGDASYYAVENGVAVWNIDQTQFYTCVKNNQDFLGFTLELDYRDAVFAFSVNVSEVQTSGVEQRGVMAIPPGQVELWLDTDAGGAGRPLIQDLDFFVKWPQICIVNKEYLDTTDSKQRIIFRGTGFCQSDLSLEPITEAGFVRHQMLSQNEQFMVRDDRVCRIIADGELYDRSEVAFAEDGVAMLTTKIRNGAPYQVLNPVIPMVGLTDVDTYTLRKRAQVVDEAVSGYLTLKGVETEDASVNPIPYYHHLYSPFVAKIIYDLLDGLLPYEEFKGEYSTTLLKTRLAGYSWILDFDPVLKNLDADYVEIHPHPEKDPLKLNIYQYRLVTKAIEAFLGDAITINRSVLIVEEGYESEEVVITHPEGDTTEVEPLA